MPHCIKDYLVVAQNASGRNLNVPVYRFVGDKPGPKVYIQSSIHGAEVQGNVVIYHLIDALKQIDLKGEVILVPNCNPVGSNIKSGEYTLGRFDPVNGQNWNRGYFFEPELIRNFANTVDRTQPLDVIKQQFRQEIKGAIDKRLDEPWGTGLAQRLNLKLQRFAFDADVVLDLHNGPVSTRHIYVPEYARESAKHFNISNVILIPNKFAGALDEATFCQWWQLQEYLQSMDNSCDWDFNVEAFTMEMGSQEVIDFEAGCYDAQSILAYLNFKGCFENADYKADEMDRVAIYLRDYKVMYSQQGGMVEYIAKPDDRIKSGQVMAKVLNIDELDNPKATSTIVAPCDLIPILHFPSASILGGTQLYKCFTNYFAL